MNNITIAKESIGITKSKIFEIDGVCYKLPDLDYENVYVIAPNEFDVLNTCVSTGSLYELLKNMDLEASMKNEMCKISVVNMDSFQAARQFEKPLVMNFANAHNPGGGFLLGVNAQEEALCRSSTLYASITSAKAASMYKYNNTHLSRVESDYMLISPNVAVFRDEKYSLTPDIKVVSVITTPAPNRFGAAFLASDKLIKDTFVRRIRIVLAAAIKYGYKTLVLGAWGCGEFGNSPKKVATYFKEAIISDEYGKCFDEICFAIYGKEDGKNITSFKEVFSDL